MPCCATRSSVCLSIGIFTAHGVSVVDIAGVDDLWRLPAVIKGDYLRVGPEKYVDERYDAEQLDSQTTSGSLGRSLRMYATLEEGLRLRAGLWSAWLEWASP